MKIIDLYTGHATAVTDDTVVALGFFDGVHTGHAALLSRTVEEAKKRGLSALVLTFSERGSAELKSKSKRIFSEEQRLNAFREYGIRYAALLDFSHVRDMSGDDFVSDVVVSECRAKAAVCGFNFRYGKGAAGTAQTLANKMALLGRECIVCEPYKYGDAPVSASRIREAVEAGDMQSARAMLGHCFFMEAEVTHGKALGRTLGLPTANQKLPAHYVRPKNGVYVTRVNIDGQSYNAVTNVGVRPTVDDGEFVNCESHIIGYDGDLYGKSLRVEFCSFLRAEKKFDCVDELKAQIEKDRKEAEKWLITFGQS